MRRPREVTRRLGVITMLRGYSRDVTALVERPPRQGLRTGGPLNSTRERFAFFG